MGQGYRTVVTVHVVRMTQKQLLLSNLDGTGYDDPEKLQCKQ